MGRTLGVVLLSGFLVCTPAARLRAQAIRPPSRPACEQLSADALTDPAVREVCDGDAASRTANSTTDVSAKTRAWQSAADHYRRASILATNTTTQIVALSALADLYDTSRLNDFNLLELTLQELSALTPDDLSPLFRLAKAQEANGQMDSAEDTLLRARHRKPDVAEPNRRLAEFYFRLASTTAAQAEKTRIAVLRPDGNGVYDIGGLKRIDASYPPALVAAGVPGGAGVVIAVTLDVGGNVTKANVTQSVPELDDIALQEVSRWHFQPLTVNGQAVPAKTNVLVLFGPPVAKK